MGSPVGRRETTAMNDTTEDGCLSPPKTFSLWATSDAHVVREALGEGCDPSAVPRQSMKIAIEQADGPNGFHYDIGVQLGDLLDYDHETEANFRMYLAQIRHGRKDRHAWYHVGGNNDENSVLNDGVDIDNAHYRKIIDPTGEFTRTSGVDNTRRPFPVTGSYERYCFDVGNLRCLFLSDRNDLPAPYGRGEGGFYVDGAITLETYRWLVGQTLRNPDRIIAIFCHHPLKDTTIGTGIDESWQGQYMTRFNVKCQERPENRLQAVLHQVYDTDPFDSPRFRNLLGQNTGIVDLWISGHVHHRVDETFHGRGKYACAFGGHHFNVGTICRYRHFCNIISAQSTLFTFAEGREWFESKVYVHDHPTIPQGFYEPEHRRLKLKKPFSWHYHGGCVTPPRRNVDRLFIGNAASGQLELRWRNTATGLLIVKKHGVPPTFSPTDGQTYCVGEDVGDGEVVFMGADECVSEPVPWQQADVFYSAFAYAAGNDQIRYFPGNACEQKVTANIVEPRGTRISPS